MVRAEVTIVKKLPVWLMCIARVSCMDPACPASEIGVNVLRAADGSTTQSLGDLPLLPPGTSQASYGPFSACGDFDGIIVLGGPAALDPEDTYYSKTKSYRQSLMMFIDYVNKDRGGLAVAGLRYGLRIHWVGDSSAFNFVTNATAHAIRNLGADFVFPSYGSTATALVSKQAFAENTIMLSWASAGTGPHSQNNLSFGLRPLMSENIRPAIRAIAAAADAIDAGTAASSDRCAAPGCKASIKVGTLSVNRGINLIGARFVAQQAVSSGLAVATGTNEVGDVCCPSAGCCAWGTDYVGEEPLTVVVEQGASIDDVINKLQILQNAGVNVVFTVANHLHETWMFMEALERMDFSPLATVSTFAVETELHQSRVEGGWWQGEYLIGAVPWHRTVNSYGAFSQTSSADWADLYEARWQGETPDTGAAAAYAMACVLGAAIETASSMDTDEVAAALRDIDLTEFFVRARFNEDGQILRATSAIQFEPGGTESVVVHPPEFSQGARTHFPTPTWGKRRCQVQGPGQPVGAEVSEFDRVAWQQRRTVECSGHGACDDTGECSCSPGYAGVTCASMVKMVPQTMLDRAQELVETLNCRSEAASTQSECSSTTFVCGATCTDAEPVRSQALLAFMNEVADVDHFSISGTTDDVSALSCTASVVRISFAQLHNITSAELGTIVASESNLTMTSSTVRGNVNTATGTAGLYASQSSALVTHTDFLHNSVQPVSMDAQLTAAGSCVACDACEIVVASSRFSHNLGGAVITLSAHASLEMNHSAVHDNRACIASGALCAATAGFLIRGGSAARIFSTLFFNNHGSSAGGRIQSSGAIFVSGFGTYAFAHGCLFYSNRGFSADLASGAVMVTESAAVTVERCTFENNLGTAPKAAGAVMSIGGTVLALSDSSLSANKVQVYQFANAGAGGVYSEHASFSLARCQITNNSAVDETDGHATTSDFGWEFYAFSPSRIRIIDSSFEPYDDSHSALISPGVARGVMRGSCEEYPCSPGSECSYTNASLSCTPCQDQTFSSDGISCQLCPAGTGPVDGQHACSACVGNEYSNYGVCQACDGQASSDHTVCDSCPPGQIPKLDKTGCQCELGTYNYSAWQGLITCVDQDFLPGAFDRDPRYAIARDQLEHQQQCINCPACVDCFDSRSPMRVRPGFGFAITQNTSNGHHMKNTTLMRCRPETVHKDAYGAGELGISSDGGKAQCLGGDFSPDLEQSSCNTGHEGRLCGVCMPGFGRRDENECLPCEQFVDPHSVARLVGRIASMCLALGLILISLSFYIGDVYVYAEADAGESVWENPLSSETGDQGKPVQQRRAVSVTQILKTSRRILGTGVDISMQPAKIFVGYFQIAAHLGDVLHTEFPPLISALYQKFKWLVVNINGLVALECAGLKDFHQTWALEVIVVPAIMATVVAVCWLHRRSTQSLAIADAKLMQESFLTLFLTYPFITNRCFGLLNCRVLDENVEVLSADYSIDCNTSMHRFYATVSRILILTFSMGVPCGLIVVLVRNRQARLAQSDTPRMEYITRRVMTELKLSDLSEVQAVIVDLKLGNRFGKIVNAYRPGMFITESLDMLRKLVMVGFLAVLDLGTTSQVVVGVALSFIFFAVSIKLMPFRHVEDNFLRATSELHLFIVMLMVLIMKGDLERERWSVSTYDWLATILFIVFVPVGLLVCIVYKWRRIVNDDIASSENPQYKDLVVAAYTRHREGRDKDEDRQLLSKFLQGIEDEIDSDYHIFISYRVFADKELALQLYHALSKVTLQETGKKLRVYLDQVCLQDGQRWDQGFMQGLSNSWVVVPILSNDCIESMQASFARETPDNVLLEWMGTLELFSRGQVKAILPLISPEPNGKTFDFSLLDRLSLDDHKPTVAAAVRHLRDHVSSAGLEDSELLNGATRIANDASSESTVGCLSVKGVVAAILRFQGVFLGDRNDSDSLRLQLQDLETLDEMIAKAVYDHGMNQADFNGLHREAVVDKIASSAPPAPTDVMAECARRMRKTVAAILGGTLNEDVVDLRKTLSKDLEGNTKQAV